MRTTRSGASLSTPLEAETPSTFKGTLGRFQYGNGTIDGSPVEPPDVPLHRLRSGVTRSPLKRKSSIFEDDTSSNLKAAKAPSPAKRRRQSTKYAPPSKYAHLPPLTDILEPDLIAVFVGFNPGVRTAASGHAYAHPSNLFWKLLHASGLTDRRWRPEEDGNLPNIGLGNTNLVDRPSKNAGELSKEERAAGAPVLEDKVRKYRPEAVCIVGKSIWEDIWRFRYGRNPKRTEFRYGWQDECENMGKIKSADSGDGESWQGARVFVTTSTSGLSASLKPAEKEAIWKPFGEWVQQRRKDRSAGCTAADADCH